MIFIFYLIISVISTPPACFLSCINEVARICNGHNNLSCLCLKNDEIINCLVDICPYGNFESARDHYLGTCLEHKKPTSLISSTTEIDTKTSMPMPMPISTSISIDNDRPNADAPNTEEDCDNETKTKVYKTKTITLSYDVSSTEDCLPTKTEPCEDDTDYEESNPSYGEQPDSESESDQDQEYDECEWEEEEHTDDDGFVIIIRKPINVPEKYRQPPYTDSKRRMVIIKRPKNNFKTTSKSSKSSKFKDLKNKLPNIEDFKNLKPEMDFNKIKPNLNMNKMKNSMMNKFKNLKTQPSVSPYLN